MKITNNEIVVEFPESRHPELNDTCTVQYAAGYNQSILNVKQINPPRVVDVAALATLIGDSDYSYDGNSEKLAQHLASNLDKWLIEKKEDRTDEQ